MKRPLSAPPIFIVPELSGYLYMLGLCGEPDCGDNALNQTPVRGLLFFEVKRWYLGYRRRPTRMLRDTECLMRQVSGSQN